MIKNGQNITVVGTSGNIIGSTYSKRAKGLVKKGRAEYLTDDMIRLYGCPTCDNTEENTMDILIDNNVSMPENAKPENSTPRYLHINPRSWKKHAYTEQSTNFERFFMTTPFGSSMQEVLSIGTWGSNWCEITNGSERLEKNTEYRLVFWLNGGENDRNNEVCQLHVIFTNKPDDVPSEDWNNKLCYKLNRSYIKPLKKYKGWELYEIPFVTGDSEFVQLRFVAQYAPMAIMHADNPESYADLKDEPDPYADERPQRHNIIFEDGWPTNTWYATKKLRSGSDNIQRSGAEDGFDGQQSLAAMIAGFIDIDELADSVTSSIDIDEIKNAVIDKLSE